MSILNRKKETDDRAADTRTDTVDVRDETVARERSNDLRDSDRELRHDHDSEYVNRDRDGVDDRDERVVDRDRDGVDDRDGRIVTRRHHPEAVLARQRAAYGGVKLGAAFFGWLTALGAAVVIIGLLSAIGAAVNLSTDTDLSAATGASDTTLTITGAVIVGVVLFVAYYIGGYVAGRMARFSGLSNGFAVWAIALVAAVIIGVLTAIFGSQYDVFANVNGFPSLNVGFDATGAAVTAAAIAIFVSLGGALLGGLAGMRYHRKVDRVALDEPVA